MTGKFLEKLYASNMALCALVIIVSVGVYFNTTLNGFVWDDNAMVVANEYIRSLDFNSLKLFFTSGKAHNHALGEIYRPLSLVSYAIDYKLFGLKPAGFHATNVILHALNSALVFLLLFSILRDKVTSLAAALVFAAHPIHTEAVAWIKDRDDLLALFFMLFSFIWHIKSARAENGRASTVAFAASLLLYALALSAKEMAVVLPLLIVLYAVCFTPERLRERGAALKIIAFFVLTIAYLGVRTLVLQQVGQSGHMGGGLYPAMLTMTRGVAKYMELLVMPTNLSADYATFAISRSISLGVIGATILILAVMAIGAFAYNVSKPVTFGVFWFFISLLPVSNIIPVKIPIAERFLYTPSLGFSLVIGLAFAWGVRRKGAARALALALFVAVLALYSYGTIKRNAVWRDGLTLFTDVIEKHPGNVTAHINVGNHHFNKGDMEKALYHYRAAAGINPYDVAAIESVASVLEKTGKLGEARAAYENAADVAKTSPERATHDFSLPFILHSLGRVSRKEGRIDEAVSTELEALSLDPKLVDAYIELGGLYIVKGDWAAATAALMRALELKPQDRTALLSLGYAYVGAGDCENAVKTLDKLSQIDPQNDRAAALLGKCKQTQAKEAK